MNTDSQLIILPVFDRVEETLKIEAMENQGWTRIDRRSVELPMSDGMQLPCRILQFSRGTWNTEKVIVLNYYIVDGQYCQDVSHLRLKIWRGSGAVGYTAQVQIVASVTDSMITDSAERMVCEFAVESASSISRLFESAEESQPSDEDSSDVNRMFGGTGNG